MPAMGMGINLLAVDREETSMKRTVPIIALSLACALLVAGCGCSMQQQAETAPEERLVDDAAGVDETDDITGLEEDAEKPDAEKPDGDPADEEAVSDDSDEPVAVGESPVATDDEKLSAADGEVDDESVAEAVDAGVTVGADSLDRLVEWGISTWETLSGTASEQLEARRTATPTHAAVGEEVAATENLAVSVVSVEEGPFDYLDQTPTVMVTVRMRNTSDHVVTVKASNWDADNSDGLRVDHKYVVMGEDNQVAAQSFSVARISPGATYEAVVFFDGDALVSVIYEPHWMVSAENEYIYFDL